ncbi:MAG: AmmeMemoRadiSam system radical SAM enzyme [Syntrophaceae bacterium]|nr:AmmeMemoRadiSam system radical SAM enzyme [Syntrophaceae bacterium]
MISGMGGSTFFSGEALGKSPLPKEAMFYKNLDGQTVQCQICPRECVIGDGKRGFCRNRENQKGKLYTIVYGKPAVVDIGPIEKAPLYHFIPGHSRLCLTCASCNLRCKYCQNWHLSQKSVDELSHSYYSPAEIIHEAKKQRLNSISFTYTEPTVYYEYLYDISAIARQSGIKTSIVSNGYMNREPLLQLLKVLDAVKIDLKGFSEKFYEEVCSATLKPILESLITVKKEKVWLEIVNLVVPTLNDNPEMIDEMCRWIRENLGVDTPIHFTRFFPNYKLTHLSPTPVSTLETAYEIAKRNGLRYVYIGNVPGHIRNSTNCPSCNRRIIHRSHFDIVEMSVVNGKCKFCNLSVAGKWT